MSPRSTTWRQPNQSFKYGRHFRLGAGVVAADENVMVSTGDQLRIDHDQGVDGVESLDDPGVREGARGGQHEYGGQADGSEGLTEA